MFLTVSLTGYMNGAFGDMIDMTAKFESGHAKIMSRTYAENQNQIPNDLALLEVSPMIQDLEEKYPTMEWVKRIRFGGLIDIPDKQGNTIKQGPSFGLALELFDNNSELNRFNIKNSIVDGQLPTKETEALLGHDFSKKLDVNIGDKFTYFGSTMEGSMSFKTFTIVGTVRFGVGLWIKA